MADETGGKVQDWQKADARVLGQILAAQNVIFVLSDTTRIAEFYARTLISVPGISACRACLGNVSAQAGEMDAGVCAECEAARREASGTCVFGPADAELSCRLVGLPGIGFTAIASSSHHFGFFIFRIADDALFEVYRPFIGNLANYVAISLENSLQKNLLQKANEELGRRVEESKRAELEMQRLNGELREKSKEIENFIYITTHDLRAPLLNIQGFSRNLLKYYNDLGDMLKSETFSGEMRREALKLAAGQIPDALNFIFEGSSRMEALISALLKVARQGMVEMRPEIIDMKAAVEKILAALRYQVEEAGAEIIIGGLPQCKADPGAVNQLFSNLLVNALKYRDKSRGLKIAIEGKMSVAGRALYIVSDNGIGISEKDLPRIWQIFFSAAVPGVKKGEGIGLTMVKSMVEKNGGMVRVESREGVGTIFSVELPACYPAA